MMKRLMMIASAGVLALSPVAAFAKEAAENAADPARLASARVTVDYVFPSGTYARIMNQTMDGMLGSLMEGVGKMPLRDLAAAGGVPEDAVAKLGDGSLKEIMAIYDPRYEERMQLTTRAMMAEMGTLMTQFEPAIRDGLAHAYAKRFDTEQLADLNRFFSTPTGKAYAADSLVVFMDPEVMNKMMEFMPAMMKQMPAITQKLKQATAKLPPPRKLDELTPAERDRLAELLGVPVDELGQAKDYGLEDAK